MIWYFGKSKQFWIEHLKKQLNWVFLEKNEKEEESGSENLWSFRTTTITMQERNDRFLTQPFKNVEAIRIGPWWSILGLQLCRIMCLSVKKYRSWEQFGILVLSGFQHNEQSQ